MDLPTHTGRSRTHGACPQPYSWLPRSGPARRSSSRRPRATVTRRSRRSSGRFPASTPTARGPAGTGVQVGVLRTSRGAAAGRGRTPAVTAPSPPPVSPLHPASPPAAEGGGAARRAARVLGAYALRCAAPSRLLLPLLAAAGPRWGDALTRCSLRCTGRPTG